MISAAHALMLNNRAEGPCMLTKTGPAAVLACCNRRLLAAINRWDSHDPPCPEPRYPSRRFLEISAFGGRSYVDVAVPTKRTKHHRLLGLFWHAEDHLRRPAAIDHGFVYENAV